MLCILQSHADSLDLHLVIKLRKKQLSVFFASSAVLQWSGHGDGSSAEEGEQPFTVEYARPQQPRPRLRGTRRRGAGVPVAAAERR